MRVVTERFGEIDVDDDRVLAFDEGVPGFPSARRFALVEVDDSDSFFWLQSLEDPELAFLCAVPWPFFPDYEPELSEGDQAALAVEQAEDVLVLVVLTVDRDASQVTANLMGPVMINQRTRTGRQVVLSDSDYPLRAPLSAA
jgi:flagellar assembly factor FliW